MAGKPAEPEPAGRASEVEPATHSKREPDERFAATGGRCGQVDESAGPGDTQGGQVEHVGPVAIARYVKDDGRALIVYTRDPQAPA